METLKAVIMYLVDGIVPAFIIGLLFVAGRELARGKRSAPRYRLDQIVLGQNYRTRNGGYVRCKITRATTEWEERSFTHRYTLVTLDNERLELQLDEDRIKPIA